MCSQKLEIESFEVKSFRPCSPNTFFTLKIKVNHVSLKVKTKEFQTQKIFKNKQTNNQTDKKKNTNKEKERHKDEASTNGRFKTNPTVVILGYLTPLTSSIKH